MFTAVILLVIASVVSARPEAKAPHDYNAHRISTRSVQESPRKNEELTAGFWKNQAQKTLHKKLLQRHNTNVAKNVIMFLGDGMSIPTLKAARLYWGQMYNETGEDRQLSFEKFPNIGLSKTYCVDKQVPDSACTATAYLCGVKANEATIGVTASVSRYDCPASLLEENRVASIAKWFQLKHKKTGFVTTTRVTHASPAGLYAHTADRDWESDAYNLPVNCQDIAYQLIHGDTGQAFNVIMGGGRREMIPKDVPDEEGTFGTRLDDKHLIKEWLEDKKNQNAKYAWNRTALLSEIKDDTEYLLGLFEGSHCKYHLDANKEDPSLEEMTEVAINVLSKSETGFFLFVEGGRIDHAHHDNYAKRALDETIEFSKAVQKAYDLTNEEETLIVVTSDHAHVMTVSGYPDRGNDILGSAGIADDEIAYATLSYANGPGYKSHVNNMRHDFSKDNTHDKEYRFPSLAPLEMETHGGDEVAIFANGPWSHLLEGVIEQNVIPHIMAYASCVGEGATVCDQLVARE